MINPLLKNKNYRADIDGLRAIAILSVVIFHAMPQLLPGGFTGVDMFFVISGYLISKIIYEKIQQNTFSILEFYERRIRRIFPSLLCVLLFVWIIGFILLFSSEYRIVGRHMASALGFFINFQLASNSGYFDPSTELQPLMHLWSLAIEEQFYFIFPFFIIIFWKFKKKFLHFLIFFILISFSINLFISENWPIQSFFLPFGRLWELALGGLLAYLELNSKKILENSLRFHKIKNELFAIFGFFLLLISFYFLNKNLKFPSYYALIPTIGTVFLIYSGPQTFFSKFFLSLKIMRNIGFISYPLYLWHWPLLVFPKILFSNNVSWILQTFLVLLSFLFSFWTYKYIELPLRFHKKNPTKTLIYAAAFIAILGVLTVRLDGFQWRIPTPKVAEFIPPSKAVISSGCPISDELKKQSNWCFKNNNNNTQYALVGDSHAASLYQSLAASIKKNQTWVLIGAPACNPYSKRGEGCTPYIENTLNEVLKIPSLKGVLLVFAMRDSNNKDHITNIVENYSKYIELSLFQNKKIAFFIPTPSITETPENCLSRRPFERGHIRISNHCSIARENHEQKISNYRTSLKILKQKYPQILIFDPTDYLCTSHECRVDENGVLLYDYTDHLSYIGGMRFVPDFIKKFENLK